MSIFIQRPLHTQRNSWFGFSERRVVAVHDSVRIVRARTMSMESCGQAQSCCGLWDVTGCDVLILSERGRLLCM